MKIKIFFSPPVFNEDEEKTQYARLINRAWWIIVPVPLAVLITSPIEKRTPDSVIVFSIIFLIVWLYVRYLMQQGAIKEGSFLALFISMSTITATIISLGTVHSSPTMGYMPLILFAGLVFGRKGARYTTVTVSLLVLGLILAEKNNHLSKSNPTIGYTEWVIYTIFFTIAGYITLLFFRDNQKHLKQAREEIEKRKKTEETLRIFSRAVEQSPLSIVITNANAEIYFANPNFYKLTGYTPEEALHQNPRILQSGKHAPAFYNRLWGTLTRGERWQGEFLNKKKNGDFYWERASISPMLTAEGQITHYIAVKEDVTTQKNANKKLKKQLKQIEDLQKILKQQALRDPLTDLYNRRYLNEVLKQEFPRAEREGYSISIILIDLDHLKKINDLGGHAIGDYALRVLAAQLKAFTRQTDTVCRYGGDEFAIIMPKTTSKNALVRIQELHGKMKEITLLHKAGQVLRITFSAGIATYPIHGETCEKILKLADDTLYNAKRNGRNRVELFSVE